MRDTDILDIDIPGADPAAVVAQYEPFIKKLANRYTSILDRSGAVGLDDLYQVGCIAVLEAQKKYDPAGGASFLTFIMLPIKSAMRRALGFNTRTGAAPVQLVYLDEPITIDSDGEITRIDMIPDSSILPFDEPMIEDETRNETAVQVRAAVARLKSAKQREAIQRVYFDGMERKAAAAEMGMNHKAFCSLDRAARCKLRRDYKLKQYVTDTIPFYHVGVERFRSTWTSATEAAAIWREEHLRTYLPPAKQDERTWTPKQHLAYMRRLVGKNKTDNEDG